MIGWLRLVLMIFYSPLRGVKEARDRGSLLPIAVIAVLSQLVYALASKRFAGATSLRSLLWSELFQSAMTVVLVAVVFVPVLTLVANTFERKGSFRVVLTQEYAPLAASMFYVVTASNVAAIAIAALVSRVMRFIKRLLSRPNRHKPLRGWVRAHSTTIGGSPAGQSVPAGWLRYRGSGSLDRYR